MAPTDYGIMIERLRQVEDHIIAIRADIANLASVVGVSLAGRQRGRPELQALLADIFSRHYVVAEDGTPADGAGVPENLANGEVVP